MNKPCAEQRLYYYHGRGCMRSVPSFLLPPRVVHREKKSLLMDAGGAEIIGLIVKSDTESHTYTRSEELTRRCIRLALWHLNLEALFLPSSRGRIRKNTRRHPKSAALHASTLRRACCRTNLQLRMPVLCCTLSFNVAS